MEEQVTYSTVVFKNGHPPSKSQKEEQTIYSEVEIKAPPAAQVSAPDTGDKKAVRGRDVYVLGAVLVVVYVLLLFCIAVLVYLAITMYNQRTENRQLSAQRDVLQNSTEQLKSELKNRTQLLFREKNELLNLTQDLRRQRDVLQNTTEQLMKQMSELENRTQDLSRQRDSLNWALGVIMAFNNFSVNTFCPEKQCQPCLSGWIPFKDHCYFFFNETSSWKQWNESRTYCKDRNPISDLVIIESQEEQEFIYNHTQSYYDNSRGFWIGLSKNAKTNWVWVDGQTDTLKYWMKKDLSSSGSKALMNPNVTLTKSWDRAKNDMQNKFICESKALIKV